MSPPSRFPSSRGLSRGGQDTEHACAAWTATPPPRCQLGAVVRVRKCVILEVDPRGVLRRADSRGWRLPQSAEGRSGSCCLRLTPFACQPCSVVWMALRWPDRSPAGGHLSGFQFAAIVSKVAVNLTAVFCVNSSLQCSGVNVWEYSCWAVWWSHVQFTEKL